MKKSIERILPLCLCLFATISFGNLIAQTTTDVAYSKAVDLMYSQEYLKAATAFNQTQEMAKAEHDHGSYMLSVEAEGVCYYALNFVSALRQTIDKAESYYDQYASVVNDSTRWRWLVIIHKMEACYYFCMIDVDDYAYWKAVDAFENCFYYISLLKTNTHFDDDALAISIKRDLLSLFYKSRQYEDALFEADAIYNYYAGLGYDEYASTPETHQYNLNFVDASLSYAIVLARCNRYSNTFNVLSQLPPQCEKEPSVLRTRGKILMLQYENDGVDMRDKALAYYKEYLRVKKQELNIQMRSMTEVQREQYWLNMHDFLYDCCRLSDYAPEMLYDLVLYCKGYLLEYNKPKAKSYTWKDVQRRLKKGECAIEFLQYYGPNDTKRLAALVITPNSAKPRFVTIADIDSLINYTLLSGQTLGRALVSPYGADKNAIYNDRVLPTLLWTRQLLEATGGAEKIYFSADGILQQLAIEYMMPDSTRSCRRLTTTRRLMDANKPLNHNKMMLLGGVDYAAPSSAHDMDNDEYAYLFLKPYADNISYLPGTQAEIDTIYNNRQSDQDLKIEGANASDSTFRALANHYPIVHIATHGYFCGILEDGSSLRAVLNDNSMSQSGIVFSGAQFSLKDSSYNLLSQDGLLSAKELAQISLDSVELMVLSACETGLGYITADGVYGIQRALKQAGVKAMIVSLWSVDDAATALLMTYFYRNLKEDKNADLYDAFAKARRQLMTEVKGYAFHPGSLSNKIVNKYAAPQYSNAFILIDVQ